MAIKIEMLRCFTAVAHCGNLADAADKLGRTPSAVSMMLKQFEDHLGAPLFESARKSRLTALGAFAFEESTRELAHFEGTAAAIEGFARSESGIVRVAAVPSVAEAILPQVVQDFLLAYPGVWIDISDMDSAGILRELERERVDLGFATGIEAKGGIDRPGDRLFVLLTAGNLSVTQSVVSILSRQLGDDSAGYDLMAAPSMFAALADLIQPG